MDRFPLMIFRAPGIELIHGVKCDTRVVQDEDELDDAQGEGWHLTAADAGAAVTAELEQARAEQRAAVLAQQAAAAEESANAIRAPLQAELERVSKLLDTAYRDIGLADERAKDLQAQADAAAAALKAEQDAHAATRGEKGAEIPAPAAKTGKTKA